MANVNPRTLLWVQFVVELETRRHVQVNERQTLERSRAKFVRAGLRKTRGDVNPTLEKDENRTAAVEKKAHLAFDSTPRPELDVVLDCFA